MTEISGIKKELREYWNTQGSIYDFGYESEEECSYWRDELDRIIGEGPRKILDIGTGTGFLAMNLTLLGHDVTGLDFSEDMVNQAKTKMQNRGIHWNLDMGDAEHPMYPDNTFDVVICRFLLWTLPHPAEAIAEWVRIVKPGGKVIVIDGKRKKRQAGTAKKVNNFLWMVGRRVFRGYSGIQGHNLELEKDLPYFEGISAEEIRSQYSDHNLTDCTMISLEALPGIIHRNLPWYLRFGYQSSGLVQIVSAQKPELDTGL